MQNIAERRVQHRQKMLKSGAISPDGISSTIDCIVRNCTDYGAHVTVTSALGIPPRFQFRFPDRNLICDAEIVWRLDTKLGLAFIQE